MGKLKVDLHPIFNDSRKVEAALKDALDEAESNRITLIEVIPGKGSGQLRKKVLKFFEQKEIRARYHRLEKDQANWGRLWVHLRF